MRLLVANNRANRRILWTLAAAAFGAIPAVHGFAQDATVSWTNAAGGNWTNAANWLPNTVAPNNGTPAGTNYQVTIDTAATSIYDVDLTSDVTVDELTINNAYAFLYHTAGVLTPGALNLDAGTYEIDPGATINGGSTGATITVASGALFRVTGGTLNNITFSGANITATNTTSNNPIYILNGLNGSGQNLNFTSSGGVLDFDGSSQSISDMNLTDVVNGSILTTVDVGGPTSTAPATLTINSDSSIAASHAIFIQPGAGITGSALINNGAISSNVQGSAVQVQFLDSFTNNGTISVSNNGGLNLQASLSNFTNNASIQSVGANLLLNAANWTNASTGAISATARSEVTTSGTWTNNGGITVDNSTFTWGGNWTNAGTFAAISGSIINLGGNFTLASFGSNFSYSSDSTVNITGTLTMAGNEILPLNSSTGSWNLNGGTISGGTVSTASNGQNLNVTGNASFNNVAFTGGNLNVAANASTLTINSLNMNGHTINLNGTNQATFIFGSDQTLDNVTIQDNNTQTINMASGQAGASTPTTVTFGPNAILNLGAANFINSNFINNGTINLDNYATIGNASFINNGTMTGAFKIASNSFTNNGSIIIPAGVGTFYIESLTPFVNNGTITLGVNDSINISGNLVIANGASLGGSGTITGNLLFDSDPAQMIMKIGGTVSGAASNATSTNSFDSLFVKGNVTLGGDLDLSFANNFQKSITDTETFTILAASTNPSDGGPFTLTGSFLNVANGDRLETTDGFGSFQVNYGSGAYTNDIVLSNFVATVPEPATLSLLGLGACGLLMRRRRA